MPEYFSYRLDDNTLYLEANSDTMEEINFNDGELVDVYLAPDNQYLFFPNWDEHFENRILKEGFDFEIVNSIKKVVVTCTGHEDFTMDVLEVDINVDEDDEDESVMEPVQLTLDNIYNRVMFTFYSKM